MPTLWVQHPSSNVLLLDNAGLWQIVITIFSAKRLPPQWLVEITTDTSQHRWPQDGTCQSYLSLQLLSDMKHFLIPIHPTIADYWDQISDEITKLAQ